MMKSFFRTTLSVMLAACALLLGTEAWAQQAISGKVIDTGGQPVVGATVLVEGTMNGTTTDLNGAFSLRASAGVPVIISCLGYVDVRSVLKEGMVIVISEDAELLDETVVVGYGTQKKVTLTGAIASVQSDEIVSTKNENVANMLAGKVAGFRVLQRTGEPGVLDTSFDIRGMGTPLIVIDGVPGTTADFSRLNGNEIDNITILKDASAAVYGVRAANGVVLVTTKKGTSGKAKFSYDGSFSLQVPTYEPDLMDAVEFMTIYNEQTRNMNLGTGAANVYSADEIAAYKNGTKESYDWYGIAMNKTAPMHQHNLSARGGNDRTRYYVNVGYLGQEGLASSGIQQYDRWNLRSNLQADLIDNLTMDLNISAMMDDRDGIAGSNLGVYKSMWRQLPTNNPFVDDDPSKPFNGYDSVHPAVELDKDLRGYSKTKNGKVMANGSLTYQIPWVKGLSAKVLYSYGYAYNESRVFSKQYTLYNADGSSVNSSNPNISKLTRSYTPLRDQLGQISLNYEQVFNGHSVKGLLLWEEARNESDNFWVAREFTLDVLDELFAGNSSNITGNSESGEIYTNVNKGLVGRANYSYRDKYLAEVSFRYDASSKFMSGHQWGFFPSVSAGWRISEENFIKESSLADAITNLKIRGSWGRMGDDSASSFQWLSGFNYPANTNTVWNRNYVSGSATTGVANPNITWYTADMLDLGFDLSLYHELVGVTFDWYRRDRSGLLATRAGSVPGVFGASFAEENLNSDLTTGFEAVLSHRNRIGDFRYDVSANIGYSRTKKKYVERSESTDSRDNWLNNTNDRWGSLLWGYDYEGQFESYEEAWNWANYGVTMSQNIGNQYVLPGDIKIGDWNEDGVIDANDLHVIGQNLTMPLLNYGMTINMSYKGFDLNCLLQGASGSVYQLSEKFLQALPWSGLSNGLAQFTDRWNTVNDTDNPFDPNTVWNSGYWPSNRVSNTINYSYNSWFNYKKINYLRLKSVEVGYTLPEKLFVNIPVERVRVYLNGYNLLTLSNTHGIDPERPSTNYSYVYPLMRTFSAGVNVTF